MTAKARLLIFTGDGKGKTTAALGMALRAAGHGMRVLVLQFVKGGGATGELAALGRLPGVEIVQAGLGFVPRERQGEAFAQHREAAREALGRAREALGSGRYGLVVLDEICIALAAGLIEEDEVIAALKLAAPETSAALTGRGAPRRLIELADTVTEMQCLKHGYRAGIAAQRGIEF